jgi:tetratricopeptide (TPR) repeat protein
MVLAHEQAPAKALGLLRAAIKLQPDSAEAHWLLANALLANRLPEEAVAHLRRAVQFQPDHAEALYQLGQLLFDKGSNDEARELWKKVGQLQPGLVWMPTQQALSLLNQNGRPVEALAALDRALVLRPDFHYAFYVRGKALRQLNRLDEAIEAFRQAVRLEPLLFEGFRELGLALRDKGQFAEALDALREEDRQIHELDAQAQKSPSLAETEKLSDLDSRREALLRGEVAGVSGADLQRYALFRERHGHLDEAVILLRHAVAVQPDLSDAHGNLGWLLERQGKLDEAVAASQTAIRLNPRAAWYHNNLGSALERQRQFPQARAAYKEALRLEPNHGGAATNLRNLEPLLALLPRLDAVRRGEAKPEGAKEGLQLARAAWRCGYWATAVRLYEDAFAADPGARDDLAAGHRYNAACCAARAGTEPGEGGGVPDEKERRRLRQQALAWLQADLDARSKSLQSGKPEDTKAVRETLQSWQRDADLAGLREEAAIPKLPRDEQDGCRKLWAEVSALLQRLEKKE